MRKIQLITIGQSNEYGGGASPSHWRSTRGAPHTNDGVQGNFSVRLAEKMANKKGLYVQPYNGAIGAASMPFTFCGACRPWVTSMLITAGGSVTAGGNLYSCDDAIGATQSSTVQPTGTSNITTGDGRVWLYKGAAAGIDVDQHVYRDGERGFDIKNMFAFYSFLALGAGIRSQFDETWVIISIGQTDAGLNTVNQTLMENAYKSVIDAVLARGADKVFLGNTIYCAGASIDGQFTAKITPARTSVLSFYSGNAKVYAGADLRTALGVMSAVGTFTPTTPQLESSGYHMNDIGYDRAATAWYNQFVSLGVI